jgi:hypothetical protein
LSRREVEEQLVVKAEHRRRAEEDGFGARFARLGKRFDEILGSVDGQQGQPHAQRARCYL